jgi:hypothetical protein
MDSEEAHKKQLVRKLGSDTIHILHQPKNRQRHCTDTQRRIYTHTISPHFIHLGSHFVPSPKNWDAPWATAAMNS